MKKECTICHITLEEYELREKYNNKCPMCNSVDSYADKYIMDIKRISNDESFINAMVELHEQDPIEYQLKIQQFENQKQVKQQSREEKNLPKCPRCRSTSITASQRGYSLIWGFIGSGNTVNRCSKCGHKWKPGR